LAAIVTLLKKSFKFDNFYGNLRGLIKNDENSEPKFIEILFNRTFWINSLGSGASMS